MRFSIIIPVHARTERFLQRCLGSILDQSYYAKKPHGVEIVVVQDGPCETVEATCKKYVDIKRVITDNDKTLGASAARNLGMRHANGDIIIFFDSDSFFREGALDVYDKMFLRYPDAGFIYSDYLLTDENNSVIPSLPFDKYALTARNYISTCNPVRREFIPEWDEKLESLQDWDFWLGVIDNGGEGQRIEGVFWETEPPSDESVSADSAANWLNRVEYIKSKHGIPIRDFCVCSLGAPQHALKVAKTIGADFNNEPFWRPNRYRFILLLGFYTQTSGGLPAHTMLFNNTNPDTKIGIYWIGQDIPQMKMLPHYQFIQLTEDLKQVDYHFAEYEYTGREIREDFGLPVIVRPYGMDPSPFTPGPYPDQFTVGCYHGQAGKYMIEGALELASLMPDVKFKGYGNAERFWDEPPPNFEWCGFVPSVPDFINSTTALLRVTTHDGFCISHCEWVFSGRYVISNLPYRPGATTIPHYPQGMKDPRHRRAVIDAIRDVKAQAGKKPNAERMAMRQRYIEWLDPEKWKKELRGLIK